MKKVPIGISDFKKLRDEDYLFKGLNIEKHKDIMALQGKMTGDIKILGKLLRQFVLKSVSYFDVGGYEGEKVYHAFVLSQHDVMIIPKDVSKLGIVIEFKKLDPDDEETLEETADDALKQISDKKYSTTLEGRGITNIKEIAIVFRGKEIYIKEKGAAI